MNQDKLEFVSAIMTNKEGNVLILKRRETLLLDPGKYDMCSGHMKNGECPMQSMYREIEEETGINPVEIKRIEHLGDIATPHPKFPNTISHIYHILIDLSIEEINQRIENTKDREMEYGMYLKSIDKLRKMHQETSMLRTKYTTETEKVYQVLESKLKERKEVKEKICEEK